MKKAPQAFSVAMIGILALDCTAPIQAQAECYARAPLRPIHRTYIERDVVEPGVYEVGRSPALYGWHHRAVEIRGPVVWHQEPSVFRTVPVRVRRGGGWTWEKRLIHGREVLCRVRLPATYVTAEKRILVKRGRRWAERTPPATAYVTRRVLLRPYKNYAHFQRPYIAWSRQSLSIEPEGFRWREVPAKPDC